MAKLIILEGHRLTGKSTVARELRNRINYATLINPTGFPQNGEQGLAKISSYYHAWTQFLENFSSDDTLFIFDRYMTSEMVFSRLYKDYDFNTYYDHFLNKLAEAGHEVHLFLMEIDSDEELTNRASLRNKVLFADVPENVQEIKTQREGYRRVYQELYERDLPNWHLYRLDVTGMPTEMVVTNIIEEYTSGEDL